jgi:septum formation protein
MHLILASTSPRRAELLRAAGYTFDVLPVDIDERVRAGETPRDYVRRLAAEKSAAAWDIVRLKPDGMGTIVLGADTAVVVDDHILGKPRDEGEAASMLRQLSGRRHEVLTGVSLRARGGERGFIGATGVYMMELRDEDIAWYVASGEGRDKAGAYAIQGLASRFIPGIDGSYANVVGLPVADVSLLLSTLASAG